MLAIFIALIAYVPYLVDMFRGKNKPHLYTWISIFLVTFVVAIIQFIGGGGVGAIPTAIGAVINGIILFYCLRFGTRDIIFLDKICLAIAVFGVLVFAIFHSQPLISLVIVTLAEIISFIPTFRKTRNAPYSESLTSYYLILIKLALILVALKTYNALTVSYSLVWGVIFIVFLANVHRWRSKVKSAKQIAPEPGKVT